MRYVFHSFHLAYDKYFRVNSKRNEGMNWITILQCEITINCVVTWLLHISSKVCEYARPRVSTYIRSLVTFLSRWGLAYVETRQKLAKYLQGLHNSKYVSHQHWMVWDINFQVSLSQSHTIARGWLSGLASLSPFLDL